MLSRSDIRFGSVCSSGLVWLALTFFREELALYAISGGDGKIWFNNVLFLENFFDSIYVI